jgi:hypothetical protein
VDTTSPIVVFNGLLDHVQSWEQARRSTDLAAERQHRVLILSTLQAALEELLPKNWASVPEATVDGAAPGSLEMAGARLRFSGTAIWYDKRAWYEDPLQICVDFDLDASAVAGYVVRFGDSDHGLRKYGYEIHARHRHQRLPERWCFQFDGPDKSLERTQEG